MKTVLIIIALILFTWLFSIFVLPHYLLYKYGSKPCTCYGIKIDINGEKCWGVRTVCTGLIQPIDNFPTGN